MVPFLLFSPMQSANSLKFAQNFAPTFEKDTGDIGQSLQRIFLGAFSAICILIAILWITEFRRMRWRLFTPLCARLSAHLYEQGGHAPNTRSTRTPNPRRKPCDLALA